MRHTKKQKHHHRRAVSAFIVLLLLGCCFIGNKVFNTETEEPVVATQATSSSDFLKEITRGDTSKNQVIFTFDGGSGSTSADRILEVLKKHNVTGTFFLTGKFVLHNQELVRRMVAEGHEVFNHSYDHPHFTELTTEAIISQLNHMDMIFKMITGNTTQPYFRPPYGDRDERVLSVSAKAGYRSVYWTIDAKDWMAGEDGAALNAISDNEVRSRILDNVAPGTIYLMHLGDPIAGQILDEVFTEIENRGYKLVSLTQGI